MNAHAVIINPGGVHRALFGFQLVCWSFSAVDPLDPLCGTIPSFSSQSRQTSCERGAKLCIKPEHGPFCVRVRTQLCSITIVLVYVNFSSTCPSLLPAKVWQMTQTTKSGRLQGCCINYRLYWSSFVCRHPQTQKTVVEIGRDSRLSLSPLDQVRGVSPNSDQTVRTGQRWNPATMLTISVSKIFAQFRARTLFPIVNYSFKVEKLTLSISVPKYSSIYCWRSDGE